MARFDLIVIGGGAAGLSAAATAAGCGLTTLLIDRMGGGGELMNLGPLVDVDGEQTGPDLAAMLLDQVVTAGAELTVAEVTGLAMTASGWRVTADDGEAHEARAVILAVGLAPGTLALAEEATFEGQGLSHCAACDGPLYAGQPVVVAGADRWARHEAVELAAMASSVTLVTQGAPPAAAVPIVGVPGVTVLEGRITGLTGEGGLEAVTLRPSDGGAPRHLPARAVFVQTGRRPALSFAPAGLIRDAAGLIVADDVGRTNLPALFAVGDARSGSARMLAAAIEDGALAARAVAGNANPLGKVADSG